MTHQSDFSSSTGVKCSHAALTRFHARAAWFLRLRWRTDDTGRMEIALGIDQVAMLLQTFNDVRLFCWDRMQRPDPIPHLEHFKLQLEGFPKVGKSLICALELSSVIQAEVARRIEGSIGHGESVTAHCSDAGEPSGTAGRPALAVLQGSGLGDAAVVVTRYFGGTKLGTGGLVRAYSDAVRSVLAGLSKAMKSVAPDRLCGA